jgi:putative heme iron utilization protein
VIVDRLADEARAFVELQARSYERAGHAITSSWPEEDAMTAEELAAFLERNDYAVLATVTPDRRAQAAPIAYFVRDGSFWIGTIAGARLRNLRANPHAALVIAEGRRNTHSALRAEGGVALHEGDAIDRLRPSWQERHGSDASWASAFIQLRPRTLFTHANR